VIPDATRDDRFARDRYLRGWTAAPCWSSRCSAEARPGRCSCWRTGSADLTSDPAVAGTVLHLRDVTERQRLETDLRHAQKMESVGQLAAGVAHEINTPIQFVADNLRFIADSMGSLEMVFDGYRQALFEATGPEELTPAARRMPSPTSTKRSGIR
jgi:signal transduction histidine kinase